MSRPSLSIEPARGQARAVALLCYGGKVESRAPSRPWHLGSVRLGPFARRLHRAGAAAGLEVATLRYRLRGWNGGEPPLADARWALDRLAAEQGDVPIVLVGHSMGGRVALRVAGHPLVRGVVALAPWLDDTDPHHHLADRRLLIVHGTADRWTSPARSLAFARRVEGLGADVRRVELSRHGHFMLLRPWLWHGLATDTVMAWLGDTLDQPFTTRASPYLRRIGEDPSKLRIRF